MGALHRLRRTTYITLFLMGTLLGLGLSRLRFGVTSEVMMAAVALIAVGLKRRIVLSIGLLVLGASLGLWRGETFMSEVDSLATLSGQQIVVHGVAASDSVYGDRGQLEFDMENLQVAASKPSTLAGKMLVRGFGENMIYKGDTVEVSGKLYLSRGSRQSGMSFANIQVLSRSQSTLDGWRRKFEAGMLSALPEPLGSFGLGLLIGQRNNLPKVLSDELSVVGLTHIVAVSGYNLTIILRAMKRLLAHRSKFQATAVSVVLMLVFLLCTGFSASIVRASLVSSLSLWAWYYGRTFKPLLLILLAASMTALFNPFYVWSDIGWYLSFLAFFGVLVIGPLLVKTLSKRGEPKVFLAVISETLSAQLMTTPIIMYIFGRFSLIAIVSNMLIVPLVSLAMLGSLIAGLGGMLLPAVSGWLAWPARYLLTYMVDLVHILAGVSWASFALPLSLAWMLLAYAGLVVAILALARKNRGKDGTITSLETSS
jgi:competence protein ComEC